MDQLSRGYFEDMFESIGIRPVFDWLPKTSKLKEEIAGKFKFSVLDLAAVENLISTEARYESNKAFKDGLRIGAMLYKELTEKEKAAPDEQDSGT